MHYLEFLSRLHATLQPRTYLEVGIRNGDSLALSRCQSIGIDPDFNLTAEITAPHELFRVTSDDYFESLGGSRPFGDAPIDLAFIDGMHLFEFALKDFLNVERFTDADSVIVFDDMLPRDVDEAARDRHTQAWTGDVFKIRGVLAERRPDLSLTVVDTQPTGLLLVTNLSPGNEVLARDYDAIVEATVAPDPQRVPDEVLRRTMAVSPEEALGLANWSAIAARRAPSPTRSWFRRQRGPRV